MITNTALIKMLQESLQKENGMKKLHKRRFRINSDSASHTTHNIVNLKTTPIILTVQQVYNFIA